MVENMFKDAKFRDLFVCRNSEVAVYQCSFQAYPFEDDDTVVMHRLFTKDHILDVMPDGAVPPDDEELEDLLPEECVSLSGGEFDIVGHYCSTIGDDADKRRLNSD